MVTKEPQIFFFDAVALKELALRNKDVYAKAAPFPHIVLDNFLPENAANALLEEFPGPNDISWINYKSKVDKKLESKNEAELQAFVPQILVDAARVVRDKIKKNNDD